MNIIKHNKPELKMPEFLCDVELTKHLNEDPLLKHMNKRFVCAMIGKAGSGKSSLMLALLQTKKKFKEVFHKIYVWMPETSKRSIKKCAFDVLPDNQQFEGVTFDSLQDVYDHLKDNSSKKQWSLLVFDDVQAYLKNTEIQKALLHIIANSRHLKTCVFICAQNYMKIPPQIRISFTDLFLFNISKAEYEHIYEEIVEVNKNEYYDVISLYQKYKKSDDHSFLYIHNKTLFFINWDEIEFV
eukprot:gene24720-gene21369